MTPEATNLNVTALIQHDAALSVKLSPTRTLAAALVADFAAIENTLAECARRLDRITNERGAYALEYLQQCRDKFGAVMSASDDESRALLLDELKGLLTGLASYVPAQRIIVNANGEKSPLDDETVARWKLTKRSMRAAASLPPVHRSQQVANALSGIAAMREKREQERANKSTVEATDKSAGKTPRKTSKATPQDTPQDTPTGK